MCGVKYVVGRVLDSDDVALRRLGGFEVPLRVEFRDARRSEEQNVVSPVSLGRWLVICFEQLGLCRGEPCDGYAGAGA